MEFNFLWKNQAYIYSYTFYVIQTEGEKTLFKDEEEIKILQNYLAIKGKRLLLTYCKYYYLMKLKDQIIV